MKLRVWVGTMFAICLGSSMAAAAADAWSGFFAIRTIDTNDQGDKETLVLRKVGLGNFNNPAGCVGSLSYASTKVGSSALAKDLMNRQLTSAFLTGRKVRVFMSGNNCSEGTTAGNPIFFAVALDQEE